VPRCVPPSQFAFLAPPEAQVLTFLRFFFLSFDSPIVLLPVQYFHARFSPLFETYKIPPFCSGSPQSLKSRPILTLCPISSSHPSHSVLQDLDSSWHLYLSPWLLLYGLVIPSITSFRQSPILGRWREGTRRGFIPVRTAAPPLRQCSPFYLFPPSRLQPL